MDALFSAVDSISGPKSNEVSPSYVTVQTQSRNDRRVWQFQNALQRVELSLKAIRPSVEPNAQVLTLSVARSATYVSRPTSEPERKMARGKLAGRLPNVMGNWQRG